MKDLIAKILAERKPLKVKNKFYWISQKISWEIKLEAEIVYKQYLEKYRSHGMFRRSQINDLLRLADIEVNDLEELNKKSNELKVRLYKKYPDTFAQKFVRAELKAVKKAINNIYINVSMLDSYTLETYADKLSIFYIFKKTCDCPKTFNFLNKLYYRYLEDSCSLSDIRALARDDYWRSLWLTKKGGVFKYVPLTDEQISLASYSRMYENIAKHPEAPPDEIIRDDDMLDGWLIIQGEEKSKDKKQPDYGSKINSSQEVFVMANNQEHANDIYSMNTVEQRAVQNVRARQLKNSGAMEFHKFADQQRKVQNAAR